MNKNLEKEYKELMAENVPDLWERIESGLEPKQSAAKKGSLWRRYGMWGFAVAACLCMVVTVPAILSRSMRYGSAPAYEGSMAPSAMENSSALFEAPSIEETVLTYTIMGTVTEVLEEDGRRVYIVEIFRTDLTELTEGDSIRLYSDWDFSQEILEGEEYLFDIVISTDNNGTREYLIEDIW